MDHDNSIFEAELLDEAHISFNTHIMALHFVTTAVLTADNAGQFNKEVLTEEGEKIKEKAANSRQELAASILR